MINKLYTTRKERTSAYTGCSRSNQSVFSCVRLLTPVHNKDLPSRLGRYNTQTATLQRAKTPPNE